MKRVAAGAFACALGLTFSVLAVGLRQDGGAWLVDAAGWLFLLPFVVIPPIVCGVAGLFAAEFAMEKLRAPVGALLLVCAAATAMTLLRGGDHAPPLVGVPPLLTTAVAIATYVMMTSGALSTTLAEARPLWVRVVTGICSTLLGLVSGFLGLWLVLGGPERADAAGWTLILSIFVLGPMLFVVPAAVAGLDLLVAKCKPRMLPLALVAVAPALVFFVGWPWAFEGLDAGAGPWLMFAVGTLIPASIAGAVHLLLSAPALWRPRLVAPKHTSAPSKPANVEIAPTLFTTIVLKQPPDTRQLIDILTSPRLRIGQHRFLYAAQVLALAGAVWFPLPFLLGAWMDLPKDLELVVSWTGWFALLWSAFCLTANRVHDLGLSGLWGVAPLALAAMWLLAEGPPDTGWVSMTTLTHAITAGAFCYAAALAVLLPLKGQAWSNEYGAAPD